jgi:hypothetical protein
MICVRCLLPLLGWAYIYKLKKYVPSDVLNVEGRRILFLGDCLLIMQSLIVGSVLLTWIVTYDNCESSHCGADLPENTLPLALVLYVFVGSIATPLFYTCHHVFASLLSIVIAYSMLLAVGIMAHVHSNELLSLFVISVLMFYVLACHQGVILSNYYNYSSFETTLRMKVTSENQEFLMKVQTEEMRHMIGE